MNDIFKRYNTDPKTFDKIEKEVLWHMMKPYIEVNGAIRLLEKNNNLKFLEATLVLSFVLADTIAKYYQLMESIAEEVQNPLKRLLRLFFPRKKLPFSNEKRFRRWINNFVLNDCNEIYSQNKKSINCDSGIVWALRNSLIHFYGLPNLEYERGESIVLTNGVWTEDEKYKNWLSEFKKRGKNVRMVDVHGLKEAILASFESWSNYLKTKIEKEPEKYLQAILQILATINQEGAIKTDSDGKIISDLPYPRKAT